MSIVLTPLSDTKYCKQLCYELGLVNFKIRKAFTNINKIQEIYSECISNSNNQINYNDKILVLEKKHITIQNIEYIIKNTYPISFTIIELLNDNYIIIIPITWNNFLLFEPNKSIATIFLYEGLYRYILYNYKDIFLYSKHCIKS